jgi:hypothetical protein
MPGASRSWPAIGRTSIALEVLDKKGRIDLEIRLADALVICEAKRGWLLPSTSQLSQYAGRYAAIRSATTAQAFLRP